jgi:hypothetical protein
MIGPNRRQLAMPLGLDQVRDEQISEPKVTCWRSSGSARCRAVSGRIMFRAI